MIILAITVSRDVTLYVGFEPRVPRVFLVGFPIGRQQVSVYVDGNAMGFFELYRRDFPAGLVTLGSNSAQGAAWVGEGRSHYGVAMRARDH